MINEAIADLLERFTPGVWMEWSLHFNPDANRRLRICENEDWIESGPAIQGVRWRAYRITPLGQAALDIFLMSRLENSKKKAYAQGVGPSSRELSQSQ